MSIKNRLRLLVAISTTFVCNTAFSQSTVSTYSALGIGELNNSGLTTNQAMGGLGISFGTGWGANYVNPALSVRNTVFNFQSAFNYRRIDVSTSSQNEKLDGGGLSYIAMSLPVKTGKSALGMGLNQISNVNYNLLVNSPVANTDFSSVNLISGNGGISEAYLSSGYLLAKNLSVGAHLSYLFGSTIRKNNLSIQDKDKNSIAVNSEYYERFTVSDFSIKGGIHYFIKLGSTSNLHFGAIYQNFGDIKGKEFVRVGAQKPGSTEKMATDTLRNNLPGFVSVPSRTGFGITYEKVNKFSLGIETQFQDFTKFRSLSGDSNELSSVYKIGFGGQFTPDYFSVDNFLKRTTYRMGIEYQQTPYLVNQVQIKDFGINIGGSLPMNSLSLVNFAIKFGSRGTIDSGLIKENYVNFSLGFSLNDNSWFYKRSFE
jgi:hypothetical protein